MSLQLHEKKQSNSIINNNSNSLPLTHSYSTLNQFYHQAVKDISEKKKEEEKRTEEGIRKELEDEFGKTQITKESPYSLVCDGAKLHCNCGILEVPKTPVYTSAPSMPYMNSNSINAQYSSPYPYTKPPEKGAMIDFKIPKSNAYLMGIDPMATTKDNLPENFEPKPNLECKFGGKCMIKELAGEWSDYSETLIINGHNSLLKKSKLKCKKNEEAEVTIIDNGQDIVIRDAFLGSILNPTERTVVKTGIIITIAFISIKGTVIAVKEAGGLIYILNTYNQGYAYGGVAGGLLHLEKTTGVVTTGFTAVNTIGHIGGQTFVERVQSYVGEPGVQAYKGAEFFFSYGLPISGIVEKGVVVNQKLNLEKGLLEKEIENNNKKISLVSNKSGYNYPFDEFTEKDIKNLQNQLDYLNKNQVGTIKNVVGEEAYNFVKDEVVITYVREEVPITMLNSIPMEWREYYLQLEARKNGMFFTSEKVGGIGE